MKKLFLLFIFLLSASAMKAIELKPYSGVVYSNKWGLQTGMDVEFHCKNNFYLQTGLMFYSNVGKKYYSDWEIGINLPVFMQYRFPISNKIKMDINLGPYVGIASVGQVGVAGKVGLDISNINLNVSYFRNCVTDHLEVLGLSIGYKFSIK